MYAAMNEPLGKYMTAVRVEQNARRTTYHWDILARDKSVLGFVAWYTKSRQYCFEPNGQTVYSMGCLLDMADFLRRVNKEHEPAYRPKR